MKKILAAIVLAALVWGLGRWHSEDLTGTPSAADPPNVSSLPESRTSPRADSESRAGSQFESEGTVVRVLPDDNEGSRHQRFIVRLSSGRTVLIAHNIDLAPRVADLEVGDTVAFSGELDFAAEGHALSRDVVPRCVG